MNILAPDRIVALMKSEPLRACFEGIRELRALPREAPPSRGDPLFERCLLRCQEGGRAHAAEQCRHCAHFVNWLPERQGGPIVIRCLWDEHDPVAGIMTLSTALITVAPSAFVADADRLARRHGNLHLLVVDHGELVGVVCRCDLIPPVRQGEVVADRMAATVLALPIGATLADAVAALRERRVGCLPVVRDGVVSGVITRDHLRCLGLEDDLLGAGRCAVCGARRAVRRHPRLDALELCLDCLAQERADSAACELGSGE
jgi:CBS domain-containing protein